MVGMALVAMMVLPCSGETGQWTVFSAGGVVFGSVGTSVSVVICVIALCEAKASSELRITNEELRMKQRLASR